MLLWEQEKELKKEPYCAERNANGLFRGCAFSTSSNVHTVTALWIEHAEECPWAFTVCTFQNNLQYLFSVAFRWTGIFFLKRPKDCGLHILGKKHFCSTSDVVCLAMLLMSPGRRGAQGFPHHLLSCQPFRLPGGRYLFVLHLKEKEIWISGFGSVGHFNT